MKIDAGFGKVLADVQGGKLVIILDDKGREDEGDLFVAAEKVTPEAVNFMATHGRGLVCMPITPKRADELGIKPMVPDKENTEKERCTFAVSIDAKKGTTTGISAFDRALTIQKVMDSSAVGSDFRRPGHVFPLIARDGGLAVRQGHTEAATDLARCAGLRAAGVICEIMNDDGTMAHGKELEEFVRHHHLQIVRIADIIEYQLTCKNGGFGDMPKSNLISSKMMKKG